MRPSELALEASNEETRVRVQAKHANCRQSTFDSCEQNACLRRGSFAARHRCAIVVGYGPGQASKAHVHPGSVFAYVIEGELISQLEGQPPVAYKAGQSWYEPPRVLHLVSRNASSTAAAKLLAVLIVDDGMPSKEPWPR
jgi:quercetin dioxygenase-like cupin family protein